MVWIVEVTECVFMRGLVRI